MHDQVAVKRPHARIVHIELNHEIGRQLGRAPAQLRTIPPLRILRPRNLAIPLAPPLGQDPEIRVAVQVHVVHDGKHVAHDHAHRGLVAVVEHVVLGVGEPGRVPDAGFVEEAGRVVCAEGDVVYGEDEVAGCVWGGGYVELLGEGGFGDGLDVERDGGFEGVLGRGLVGGGWTVGGVRTLRQSVDSQAWPSVSGRMSRSASS